MSPSRTARLNIADNRSLYLLDVACETSPNKPSTKCSTSAVVMLSSFRSPKAARSVEGYLAVMGRLFSVRRERDRCRACGITTWVASTFSESLDH
jgi:hypothetical protein